MPTPSNLIYTVVRWERAISSTYKHLSWLPPADVSDYTRYDYLVSKYIIVTVCYTLKRYSGYQKISKFAAMM